MRISKHFGVVGSNARSWEARGDGGGQRFETVTRLVPTDPTASQERFSERCSADFQDVARTLSGSRGEPDKARPHKCNPP
jgi:hypothetical protein